MSIAEAEKHLIKDIAKRERKRREHEKERAKINHAAQLLNIMLRANKKVSKDLLGDVWGFVNELMVPLPDNNKHKSIIPKRFMGYPVKFHICINN